MYTNSQHTGQIGTDRQREALARAEQQRRAQRLRHPGRARRTLAWLRTLTTHRQP